MPEPDEGNATEDGDRILHVGNDRRHPFKISHCSEITTDRNNVAPGRQLETSTTLQLHDTEINASHRLQQILTQPSRPDFVDAPDGPSLQHCLMHLSQEAASTRLDDLRNAALLLINSVEKANTLDRVGFLTHVKSLVAVHHILVLHSRSCPNSLSPCDPDGYYQQMMAPLRLISRRQNFYPFLFWAATIEQALQRLLTKRCYWKRECCRRIGCVCMGLFFFGQFVLSVFILRINPEGIATAYRWIKGGFTNRYGKIRPWYDALIRLSQTSTNDVRHLQEFHSCYDCAVKQLQQTKSKKRRKNLLIGMTLHLQSLLCCGIAEEFREATGEKLIMLGRLIYDCPRRFKDPESIKIMKIALTHVGKAFPQGSDGVSKLIHDLTAISPSGNNCDTQALETLMSVVTGLNGFCHRHDIFQEHSKALRTIYMSPVFSDVPVFGNCGRNRHIKHFEFDVVVYETTPSSGPSSERNQVNTECSCQPVFARSVDPREVVENEGKRILLTGEPGSGKTCLAKWIAHSWAAGRLGAAFDTVYILPVRELFNRQYRQLPPLDQSLDAVIVDLYFTGNFALIPEPHTTVVENLMSPSTLLIFDGTDEADDFGIGMIRRANQYNCKLLYLGRPIDLQEVESDIGRQFGCRGMSHASFENLLQTEIGDKKDALVGYLDNHPEVSRMSRIPIIAQILCSLWTANENRLLAEDFNPSTSDLYTDMLNSMWRIYMERPKKIKEISRETVFMALQEIAFKAHKSGRLQICNSHLEQYADIHPDMQQILKRSGFLVSAIDRVNYEFGHSTFQDYFAGLYLANAFCVGTEGCDRMKSLSQFIAENKYWDKYALMFSFMTQEVSSRLGWSGFDRILRLLDKEPHEILGLQHRFLKARFLQSALDTSCETEYNQIVESKESLAIIKDAASVLFGLRRMKHFLCLRYHMAEELALVVRHFPQLLCEWIEEELQDFCRWTCGKSDMTVGFGLVMVMTKYIPNSAQRLIEILFEKRQSTNNSLIARKVDEELNDMMDVDSELVSRSTIDLQGKREAAEDNLFLKSFAEASHRIAPNDRARQGTGATEEEEAEDVGATVAFIKKGLSLGNTAMVQSGYRVINRVALLQRLEWFWTEQHPEGIPLLAATFMRIPVVATKRQGTENMQLKWQTFSLGGTHKDVNMGEYDRLMHSMMTLFFNDFPELYEIANNPISRKQGEGTVSQLLPNVTRFLDRSFLNFRR